MGRCEKITAMSSGGRESSCRHSPAGALFVLILSCSKELSILEIVSSEQESTDQVTGNKKQTARVDPLWNLCCFGPSTNRIPFLLFNRKKLKLAHHQRKNDSNAISNACSVTFPISTSWSRIPNSTFLRTVFLWGMSRHSRDISSNILQHSPTQTETYHISTES